MNDGFLDDASPGTAQPARQLDAPEELPLDFEGFYLNHQQPYHEYAETQLGDRRAAEELVHEVFLQFLASWEELLQEGNFEQCTWAILRQAVACHLGQRRKRPAFIENGPFARALRASQNQMAIVESGIGLYEAIADLPPRQFDVIVMRYVLGYPPSTAAWILGLDVRTVDYHRRRGKERLRVLLNLPVRTTAESGDTPKNGEREPQ